MLVEGCYIAVVKDTLYQRRIAMAKFVWKHRMKSILAREAGVFRQEVQDILSRKCRCSIHKAVKFANACETLGYNIPFSDWLWNRETKHPAFGGEPQDTYVKGWDKYLVK